MGWWMKRYWLFGGVNLEYPKGGLGDVIGGFHTLEEAKSAATQPWLFSDYDGPDPLSWFHIADMEAGQILVSHGEPLGCSFTMPTGRIEPQADPC